jgi:tungstate transport system substrate-binding protein
MSKRVLSWLTVLFIIVMLAACAQPAPAPTQAPAAQASAPTAVPPTAVPPTAAPEPTKAPEPTAVPPTQAPEPTKAPEATTAPTPTKVPGDLVLATTTSTADSGLLTYLLPFFEKQFGVKVGVVAVGSGQAIAIGSKGDADVLLVHSPAAENKFVADGFAKERSDVMYNDFIVVGPKDDPAKIAGMAAAKDAFKAVAAAQAPFASRGDKSGTNTKELGIWSSAAITPTKEMPWYNSLGQGMGDTLVFANEKGAYTLTDRGTYLSMQSKLPDLTILLGGNSLAENKDSSLLNPYGVLAVNPDKFPNVKADLAQKFVTWLLSVETQKLIGAYGVDKFGQPLFYPNSEEYKATREVTVKNGGKSETMTLADLQALPKVAVTGYEATGHKKGPLGKNDWAGASLKDVLLKADPTIADKANAGKLIVVTASDGWQSKLRWEELFGTPRGGQALADSYGCTDCHGMMGEGTAPKGKTPTPAIAGAAWADAAVLAPILRQKHGGINPFTPEQMSDADIAEIALWLKDTKGAAPADAYTIPADKQVVLLTYEKNGKPANGHDGLIQLIDAADKYTTRYAHWVQSIEVK